MGNKRPPKKMVEYVARYYCWGDCADPDEWDEHANQRNWKSYEEMAFVACAAVLAYQKERNGKK